MILALVHLDPLLTVPAAISLAIVIVWYWRRLGRVEAVPARRLIRKVSLTLMLLSMPAFVRGLSFLDPAVDKKAYLITWITVILLTLLIAATAMLDAWFSIRTHRKARDQHIRDTQSDIMQAVHKPQHRRSNDESGSAGSDAT